MSASKRCWKCKQMKSFELFYKHKGRPDGHQTYCKECDRNAFGSKLVCSSCNTTFRINHRNISRRKTRMCMPCASAHAAVLVAQQNRSRAKQVIHSTKGYEYVRDLSRAHGYTLKHRQIVEDVIGRELKANEVVHHVDGNRKNNIPENLWLTDSSGHRRAHRSLEVISLHLFDLGIVKFNPLKGVYELDESKITVRDGETASRNTVNV